ncbi:Ser/Thr protein phosphatase [Tritrichomonas foetus]|uniref:Serine/threonine-protein phosphatase n=1 Tax=Tritrichomonas foetus TaxID=1144522 RepID=A0A1J4KVK6_9EUKA|nr:Ser/Thr protein phosphatase [Tritrichomonas foetus]|eukprot:OHT13726.1 Ser/Thr protein phosphatase [Tritrichomonas foetus]
MKSYEIVFTEFQPYLNGTKDLKDSIPSFDESIVHDLIETSIDKLSKMPTVLNIYAPAYVIGDIHGNIQDLVNILSRFHDYTTQHFLFLGDYVDRGVHSVEVMVLLLAMMCKFPNNFFMIRGNHEFAHINRLYGFYEEIMIVYRNQDLWLDFNDLFGWLPLAAVVNNQVFCVHGGLSPLLDQVESLNDLQRPIDNYDNCPLVSDLVWSDPHDQVETYADNHRGSGVLFGEVALQNFLTKNKLKIVIRAHQCMADGFSTFATNTGITVFSSSEYCRLMHNKCGVVKIFPKGRVEMFSFSADNFDVTEPKSVMVMNKNTIGMRRVIKKATLPPVNQTKNMRTPKKPMPITTKPNYSTKTIGSKIPLPHSTQASPKLPVLGRVL